MCLPSYNHCCQFHQINAMICTYQLVFVIVNYTTLLMLPSRQILVVRTSRGRPHPTSQGRPLKTLLDHPGDVLKWRPGNVLSRRSRESLGGWFGTAPGRPLEDLQSTQTWMSKFFFLTFLSGLIRLTKSKTIWTLKVYPVKLLRWSIFCKIS